MQANSILKVHFTCDFFTALKIFFSFYFEEFIMREKTRQVDCL